GVAVNINDIIRANIARRERQETRRLNIANMRDEQEPVTIIDATRWAIESIRVLKARTLKSDGGSVRLFCALAFDCDTAIHRRSRGLNIKRRVFGQVIKPVESTLMFFRGNHIAGLGTTRG